MSLLKHVADVRVSNVDKKAYDGEAPVRLCNYTDVYYGEALRADTGSYLAATASAAQVAAFRLLPGDTVLTKDSETAEDIGVSAFIEVSAADFVCGYHLALLRPRTDLVDGKYLFWVTRSAAMRSQLAVAATGVTRYGLRSEALANVNVPLPALEEQRRIADFLDDQVTYIDRAIELRQQQTALVGERASERVRAAVLGVGQPGVRADVTTRWIASVPTDWTVEPLGRRFEILLGKMLAPDRVAGSHLRPYLRNTNVQWDRIDTHDLVLMDFPPEERRRYEVLPGDLLVCEGGEVGRAAVWDGRMAEIYYQKALHRVRPRGTTGVRWIFYVLRAATDLGIFTMESGTTIAHLTGEQLRAHRVPFPPSAVEGALVSMLDEAAREDSALGVLAGRQVALLQERKQALITAAVTGQFDVTTASTRSVA